MKSLSNAARLVKWAILIKYLYTKCTRKNRISPVYVLVAVSQSEKVSSSGKGRAPTLSRYFMRPLNEASTPSTLSSTYSGFIGELQRLWVSWAHHHVV
jgi:hypothetical protein